MHTMNDQIDTLSSRYLFDLDDTLYLRGSGMMEEVRQLIIRYMTERQGMCAEEATALRLRYQIKYGTTMAGLLWHQHIATKP